MKRRKQRTRRPRGVVTRRGERAAVGVPTEARKLGSTVCCRRCQVKEAVRVKV